MSEKKTTAAANPKNQAVQKFVNDNVIDVKDTSPVVIIREGSAPKQLDAIKPNKVHLAGVIGAPAEFYKKRKGLHDKNRCHVIYDFLGKTIVLVVDENFENDNYKVVGKLTSNPELNPFKINTGETFDPKELLKVLKFRKSLFVDKEVLANICASLQNFKAKVKAEIEKNDNQRGENLNHVYSKIEHDLAEFFVLEMKIFKGQPKLKFRVDICVELAGADPYVYLESTELKNLEDTCAEDILKDELKTFADIVCIEQ